MPCLLAQSPATIIIVTIIIVSPHKGCTHLPGQPALLDGPVVGVEGLHEEALSGRQREGLLPGVLASPATAHLQLVPGAEEAGLGPGRRRVLGLAVYTLLSTCQH